MSAKAAALLLLPTLGCAVGPNYVKPEIPVPKAWNEGRGIGATQSPASLATWWTRFQDPILDRLVNEAMAGNLDLKIAAARIRESRAARGIAGSAGLPQAGMNAAYARTHNSPVAPGVQNVFEAGFDASWEIDVFGGVRRDEEAALAEVQAAEDARREVLVTLLADVGRSYLELRGTQQQLRILEQTVGAERDTLDIARARFEAGLGTELDVARAEGLLKANEADRPVLERAARAAIYRLGVLVGREPSALASELQAAAGIPPIPPEIPTTLPSELLSRRPDLKRAERELAAATARIGVARADLFPRFSILGSFGRRSQDGSVLQSGRKRPEGRLRPVLERDPRRPLADLLGRKDPRQHRGAGRPPGASPAPLRKADPHRPRGSRDGPLRPRARAGARSFPEGRRRRHPPRVDPRQRPLHQRPGELPLRARRPAVGLRRGRPARPQRDDDRRHLDRRLQGPGRRLVADSRTA
jgi:NodT family efflux transporter outer membrane factor (OMF) lipoprotein